jgi:hypothetical protein
MGNFALRLAIGILPLGLLSSPAARATENGATEYPLGAETFGVALTPPPGHGAPPNYNEYIDARLYSSGSAVPGSHFSAFVSSYRGEYTWPVALDDGKVAF